MEIFSELNEPKTIWKRLGVIKKSVDKGLLFNTDELNDFLTIPFRLQYDNTINSKIYLGKEVYDDAKFYWANIVYPIPTL